jgi:thiol-disulfide isomerase/thioredoxin
MSMGRLWVLNGLLALAVWLTAAGAAGAAPDLPDQWVNGGPYDLGALKGKLVMLYFFEETCPNCAKKWPALNEVKKEFADQPVVFIAVNSGTDPSRVETYVKTAGVQWPVAVDPDRRFEKSMGVGTISLSNVIQLRMVLPEGKIWPGNPDHMSAEIKGYIGKAKWKVDPAGVPEALKPTWQAMEFGRYDKAGPAVRVALRSRDEKIKGAAEKISAQIDADLAAQLASAESAEKAGKAWEAYKLYADAFQTFRGNAKAEPARAAARKLAGDKAVKTELQAQAVLAQAKSLLASRNRKYQEQGEALLKELAERLPDTEAGRTAAGMAKASASQ